MFLQTWLFAQFPVGKKPLVQNERCTKKIQVENLIYFTSLLYKRSSSIVLGNTSFKDQNVTTPGYVPHVPWCTARHRENWTLQAFARLD